MEISIEATAFIMSLFVGCVLSWVTVAYLICERMELKARLKRLKRHNEQLSEAVKTKNMFFRV